MDHQEHIDRTKAKIDLLTEELGRVSNSDVKRHLEKEISLLVNGLEKIDRSDTRVAAVLCGPDEETPHQAAG